MKTISKIVALATASSCLLFGASTMAASVGPGHVSQTAKKVPVKLLFVIQAAQGALTKVEGKNYKLVVPLKDIKSVLAFSDRPNRVSFKMKPAAYAKMVQNGSDSFRKDHPNAVISVNDMKAHAWEITFYKVSGKTIQYSLKHIGTDVVQVGKGAVQMYIDGYIKIKGGGVEATKADVQE